MRRRPKANTPAQASVARIQVAILLSSFLCEIQACGKAGQAKKYSDRLALKDADSHSRHAHFFQPVGCSFQHRLHPFPNTIPFHGIRPYTSAVCAPACGNGWGATLPRCLWGLLRVCFQRAGVGLWAFPRVVENVISQNVKICQFIISQKVKIKTRPRVVPRPGLLIKRKCPTTSYSGEKV